MGFRGEDYVFASPAAAVAGLLAHLRIDTTPRRVEACALASARGRILAASVVADRDSPPFDYASMDGYAVRLTDAARQPAARAANADGVRLPVTGEARIGAAPPPMPPGPGAVRIVTGAAMPVGPSGPDLVVPRENVVEHASRVDLTRVEAITILPTTAHRLREGDSIRRRGENARAGDEVLGAGTVLSAAALGTLAAVGRVLPRVYARCRVAIITTGDELVPPESTPAAFEIRNSNGPAVSAVLGAHAWIEVASVEHVRDDGRRLGETLRDAIARADAVVLTGGVSMGHRDPVRGAIEAAGAEITFHGLPQRPGKPMLGAIAARTDGARVHVFGLPGNPLSVLVTAARIVIPVLAARAGVVRWPAPACVRLANPDGRTLGLWWHRPVRLNERGEAELVDGRGSGDIVAGGRSDGFIEVPPHTHVGDAAAASPTLYPYYPWQT
ncbi:MAG: molybdopterin molybdotransferase MoeA [Phycisphaerales bacterium]